MSLWKNYYLAIDLRDILQALENLPPPVRLVAGGTDLLLDLQQGRTAPVESLVDITRAAELRALDVRQDSRGESRLFVGAAVPLNHVAISPLVCLHAQALVEACRLIGGPQVRNSATLGGNVAHALPAGDGSISLLALDAQAEVAGLDGGRVTSLADLYLGPGKSSLLPAREVLVGFYLPLTAKGQASAFKRIMRPQGVALPILNMACWLEREEDRIIDLRLTAGPAGTTPQRLRAVEEALRGQVLDERARKNAEHALLDSAHFRTSPHRASREYRKHLAASLLQQVLQTAWERAGSH